MEAVEAAQARAVAMLTERAPAVAAALHSSQSVLAASAPGVLAASDFVLDALCRDPALWEALLARSGQRLAGEALPLPELPAAPEEALFMAALRRWRRAEFARIAWRDLAHWASLDETLTDLSRAAEGALRLAEQFAARALGLLYAHPRGVAGDLLNFPSDIDLVPLSPESGETNGARSISNQEFFTRLVQQLIRLLEQ